MATTQSKSFIIACGGTGGHLFPGISVAQEMKRRGHSVLLLVSEKAIDQRALEGHPDLESRQMAMTGKPKTLSSAMLSFIVKFWKAKRACAKLIKEMKADAVLGMGGFTSMPPIMAARGLGIPTFIHESNAIPGKANKLTAKYCSAVFLGMEACRHHFANNTCHVVGTPVRESLRGPVDREKSLAHFQLDPHTPTMLVMGGSQGASGLNKAVCDALPELDGESLQVIHLTGADEEAKVREAYEKCGMKAHVAGFCDRMDDALAVSEMAICRSGASSLSELAYFGIPSILIPYPYAAEDHQTFNAKPYVDGGAAILCCEKDLSGPDLAAQVREKFLDRAERGEMQRKMKDFSSDSANIKICDIMDSQTS